jgi:hypothetical protein
MFTKKLTILLGLTLEDTQAAHAEGPFSWQGGYDALRFKVEAVQKDDQSIVTITPSGLTVTNEPLVREIPGGVVRAEIADLNADQNIELYVYAQSPDDKHTTSVIGLSVNNGKNLSDIYFPPLTDDPVNAKGFIGKDDMAAVESAFVHRFPIEGTSKTRQLQYKLEQGEAGWIMVLDKVIEY